MLFVQLCLLSLFVLADVTESKVYLVQDSDEEPIYLNKNKEILSKRHHISKHKYLGNPKHLKPKRGKHTRQAVIHYGRHIYHLDSFEDLTKLRSPKTPDYISYDYFDLNDLARSKPIQREIPWDYLDDVVYLTDKPKMKCKGKKCAKNLRKYNKLYNKNKKYKASVDEYVKRMRIPFGTLTRFKIIDNSRPKKKSPKRYESSEERPHVKRHLKPKKKEYIPPSSSSEEERKSNSASESSSSEKKKYDSSSSSEEPTIYKKKESYSSESRSKSWEDSEVIESTSNSIEKSFQKMKKKKKYKNSEKRKTFSNEEVYLQGNKLITAGDEEEDGEDRRRRLPQFLPKRFHWEPDDMKDLGYYWFNGPKGKYPEPRTLRF